MTSPRVIATRLHGDGTESLIADELDVTGLSIHRALSGAGGLTGTITPDTARLRGRDGLLLAPGRTALYALTDAGTVLGGGILTAETTWTGETMSLDCTGHGGYLTGQPYLGDDQWIQVDPADLIRHAWAHLQARPHHNLGMAVDETTTPVRVGTEERDVSFTTSTGQEVDFTAGPVKWNSWTTHDLGAQVDALATDTPIDYATEHTWTGSTITHRLRLGYPTLGRRRADIALLVGVNVLTTPAVGPIEDVSDVLVLGAGEGSLSKRGTAHRDPGGLGRTVVLTDKNLTSNTQCDTRARQHLDWLSGGLDVTTLTVTDHPTAPLGAWAIGDEIRLQGDDTGWAGHLDTWVRILSDEIDPHTATATLTVARAARLA